MKHSIALTFVVTALGAAPVLGAEIRAEKLNRAQLVAATTAKISVKDAIAAAERLSNGGRAVEATYTLQGSPPAATATYELRAYQRQNWWRQRGFRFPDALASDSLEGWLPPVTSTHSPRLS